MALSAFEDSCTAASAVLALHSLSVVRLARHPQLEQRAVSHNRGFCVLQLGIPHSCFGAVMLRMRVCAYSIQDGMVVSSALRYECYCMVQE